MSQLEEKQPGRESKFSCLPGFTPFRLSRDCAGPIQLAEGSLLYSLRVQMLISSRNILTDMLSVWTLHGPVKLTEKVTRPTAFLVKQGGTG